jgi:hypothetical protein
MRTSLLAVAALAARSAEPRHRPRPGRPARRRPDRRPRPPPVDRSKLHVTGLTKLNAGPVEIELQDIAIARGTASAAT